MGRIKVCRVCGEVLHCKICGERQTPEAPDWKRVLLQLTPEQKEQVEQEAAGIGISVNELIRRRIMGDDDNPSTP